MIRAASPTGWNRWLYGAAEQVLADPYGLPIAKSGDGIGEQIRALLTVRSSVIKARVAAIRQIKSFRVWPEAGIRTTASPLEPAQKNDCADRCFAVLSRGVDDELMRVPQRGGRFRSRIRETPAARSRRTAGGIVPTAGVSRTLVFPFPHRPEHGPIGIRVGGRNRRAFAGGWRGIGQAGRGC